MSDNHRPVFMTSAQIMVEVDVEIGVTKVTILPAPTDLTLYDAHGASVLALDLAEKLVNEVTWGPLFGLPENVVWEG